jgi:hypothetical protein
MIAKAIAFAFLYGYSLWAVYWRGWSRGTGYTLRRIVANLVANQKMSEENATSYVMQIALPDREESKHV